MVFNCVFFSFSVLPFEESLTPPDSLPIDIQQDETATFSNITRSDANCDKTGTCYDGKDWTHMHISVMQRIAKREEEEKERTSDKDYR